VFNSTVLEVSIGLVFMFLLLSLICSSINEMIEALVKNRADKLKSAITNLLNGPASSSGSAPTQPLSQLLFQQPLIAALHVDGQLPAYIPSRTFARALFNLMAPDGAPGGLQSLRNTIQALPSTSPLSPISRGILPLIDDAQGDVNKLLGNIEDWYNHTMERVSGLYKRRAMWISFGVGLALAGIMNANTFRVAQGLWASTALRSAVVGDVQTYLRAVPAPPVQPGNAQGQSAPAAGAGGQGLQAISDDLKSIGNIPLGWRELPQGFWGWVFAMAGWLTTAIAISLGAPFWFDVLNKFMVFRAAIKPQQSTKSDE
jgi:hypothetical protein